MDPPADKNKVQVLADSCSLSRLNHEQPSLPHCPTQVVDASSCNPGAVEEALRLEAGVCLQLAIACQVFGVGR